MKLIQTDRSPEVIRFLKQKEILNLNMLGILDSTPEAEIYVDCTDRPSGVYIQANDYFGYLYTESDAFIDAVCETFMTDGYHGFSAVEDAIAQKLMARYPIDWHNPCTLYYLPKENFDPTLQKHPARPLDPKWAALVDANYPYSGDHSHAAIVDNLTRRPSAAIYEGDQPVCWVMVHEDDSMGIMHTLDAHRRKGYAVDVTIDLCQKIFDSGKTPFLQIVEGNDMSPGLALKCGFVPYGRVTWFGLKINV